MEELMIIVHGVLFYSIQAQVCVSIHILRRTRFAGGFFDFLKLTFLPYVLFKLIIKKEF